MNILRYLGLQPHAPPQAIAHCHALQAARAPSTDRRVSRPALWGVGRGCTHIRPAVAPRGTFYSASLAEFDNKAGERARRSMGGLRSV
jgi:hypothetical protein